MANSDALDLMGLGQHCSIKTCRQLDFLPFKCAKCKDIFCLDHRQERDHNCPNAGLGDSIIPVCPLCGQSVSVSRSRGESVDSQVEKHIVSGCRDHVVQITTKKVLSSSSSTSCPHRGCKRRDLVPYTCPQCERIVCIRHRQPMDHNCHQHHASFITVH